MASHSADGVIELMPVADATQLRFKYVNGHPGNTRAGLPTVMAFGVLADVATGAPRLLSELTLTTAIRTAATSALAARALARPGSRMHGADRQRRAERIPGARLSRPGRRRARCGCSTSTRAATAKLVPNLPVRAWTSRVCDSTAEAVHGADIVTTVTADKTQCHDPHARR